MSKIDANNLDEFRDGGRAPKHPQGCACLACLDPEGTLYPAPTVETEAKLIAAANNATARAMVAAVDAVKLDEFRDGAPLDALAVHDWMIVDQGDTVAFENRGVVISFSKRATEAEEWAQLAAIIGKRRTGPKDRRVDGPSDAYSRRKAQKGRRHNDTEPYA